MALFVRLAGQCSRTSRWATGPAPAELRDIRFYQPLTEPLPATDAEIALDATLRDYLEGGTNGDTTRLIRAFHPSASMNYIDGATGQFEGVPIADYLNRAKAGAGKTIQRTTRIAHREITGRAAQARVESDCPTFRFIDYFNLLLIDGRWQIVSKIFHRQEKAVK
ncbi:nuclear transport factor 2 family protein [Spirosoma areae]